MGKAGVLAKSPEWWKHLKHMKRVFWKRERHKFLLLLKREKKEQVDAGG